MDSLVLLLKSKRREDRICAVLFSLKLMDQFEQRSSTSDLLTPTKSKSIGSEAEIVNHVLQQLEIKFLIDMISCLVQYPGDSRYLMIGNSAVRFLGVACKYENLCRLVNRNEITELIELCFEDIIQSDPMLCSLMFSIIKFIASVSVESTDYATEKILEIAAETQKKRKIVGTLFRTIVDLLQICRESSNLCDNYGDTIQSLFVQGVHGAAPAEERGDALSCLRDLLSIGGPQAADAVSQSWTWTLKTRAAVEEPTMDNKERSGFFFPVFATEVVTGELHLLMEELLACCGQVSMGETEEKEDCGITARRLEQRMDAPLELVMLFLSVIVEAESAWADLPSQSLQKILRALKTAATDCADFLVEAASILGSITPSDGRPEGRSWSEVRSVAVTVTERTLTALSMFALEDDDATELLLSAVPHAIRLGRQESKKLLVMLYGCLLERIWGLEDNATNKQLEIQLRAVLEMDGPLVECAVTHLTEELSAVAKFSNCGGVVEENSVRVLAEILMLANKHWIKQADRYHTTVEILLRSDRDDTLISSLAKLKESVQNAIELVDETLKISLCSLLFCLEENNS